MRTPATTLQRLRPRSREFAIPASVGGLNARDSVTDMPSEDALVLDNFFPQPDNVELRKGFESYGTSISGAIESLMEWDGPSSKKFFCANANNIYDISSSGDVGSADVSSLTNGRWQHVMQSTSGGNFLIICNGADSVRSFDGSSWATPSITNVSSSDLINVWLHKERIWFVEVNSMSAWYLGTKAIAGAASEFPLGSVFKLGGYLVAGGSISRDGGAGPDDYCVFVSSNGEVAVYQGTDPSSANTWALIGTFYTSPPIGKRCLQKAGGDLAIITTGGIISINAMMALDRAAQDRAAITAKINKLFTTDAQLHGTHFGWQFLSYPKSNMIIANVPTGEASTQRQYIMNSLTGAWCRFTNMNAGCWGLYNDNLYFGGNSGTVWKADTGYQDNGSAITADLKTAFNYLKSPGQIKIAKMIRTLFTSNGSPGFLMDLNTDFGDTLPTSTPTSGAAPSTVWDTAEWDTDVWTSGDVLTRQWVGATGKGNAFAVRLRVSSNGASCTINSFDIIAEAGGMI